MRGGRSLVVVAVLRKTDRIKDEEVVALASALQIQVHDHFAPVWGIYAEIHFVTGAPPRNAWWLVLLDDSDQANALGYHDMTDECLPLGKVFLNTCAGAGVSWTATASHELLEMLADPGINLSVLHQDVGGQSAVELYSYEICDACEADEFGYVIGEIKVSDFVYPAWFESFRRPFSAQFDYCGRIVEPFQILAGGYATVRGLNAQDDWTQKQSARSLQVKSLTGAVVQYTGRPVVTGSRRERRRRGRSKWIGSTKQVVALGEQAPLMRIAPTVHAAGMLKSMTVISPSIITRDAKEKSVIAEIQKALEAIKSKPAALPNSDSMQLALQSAMEQAQRKDRDSDLNGAIPDDLHLALVLSSINGSAGRSRQIKTMDLLGTKQYEDLDPGWLGSLFNRLKSDRIPFPNHLDRRIDATVKISNQVRIAIAGDWGTGNYSSQNIANRMRDLKPDHTIHLGDVYYSGTDDEERNRFVGKWPSGLSSSAASFALNGNHEMYSGGDGYFVDVLSNAQFQAQRNLSYFALTNDSWVIVGMDSAYYAQDYLYQKGNLDSLQLAWLTELGRAARGVGKRVILLTHHHGIDVDPDRNLVTFQNPLWSQVIQALDGGPDYWYWGHVHAGIAYKPLPGNGRALKVRCVGHGGVPYAPFPDPESLGNSSVGIEWAETEKAGDPNEGRRALNGFMLLSFDGPHLLEEFRDENGNIRHSMKW
jgi:predicted phosphodiesterase